MNSHSDRYIRRGPYMTLHHPATSNMKHDESGFIAQLYYPGTHEFQQFNAGYPLEGTVTIIDQYNALIREYLQVTTPKYKKNPKLFDERLAAFQKANDPKTSGVWVYYPWRKTAIKLPEESIFSTIRTARNQYKIHPLEQLHLSRHTVGVAGLSVGQSVAIAMAMERSFGCIRLADFDTLELSNMNRIRSSLIHLGLPKTTITAREIAELDPFLRVEVFEEGVHPGNIDAFVEGLNVLIDECDSLDIKIMLREHARKRGIPVIMDTSDRGMIDVERFDLDKNRDLLHGLVQGVNSDKLRGLESEEKIPYILRMLEVNKISNKLKASFLEVEQTLSSWPQLATSVLAGGAGAADVYRRLVLGENIPSGRYYFDPEVAIPASKVQTKEYRTPENPYPLFGKDILQAEALKYAGTLPARTSLSIDQATTIAEAGMLAPSGGNMQPWEWVFASGRLFLFHQPSLAHSLLNFQNRGSWLALGAAVENATIRAASIGIGLHVHWNKNHIATIREPVAVLEYGEKISGTVKFAEAINLRYTDRRKGNTQPIDVENIKLLHDICAESGLSSRFIHQSEQKTALSAIIGETDLLRLYDPWGFSDFINEIRWDDHSSRSSGDGVDIETLELTEAEKAGLSIACDKEVMHYLRSNNLGTGLQELGRKSIENSGGVFVMLANRVNPDWTEWLDYGRTMERIWLAVTDMNIACQPCAPIFFLANLLRDANASDYLPNAHISERIVSLTNRMEEIMNFNHQEQTPIFMFRLFHSKLPPLKRSYRKTPAPFHIIKDEA